MIRMYVICEGQTEESFINNVIAPIFVSQQLFLTPRLISTSKGHKGGALSYERVQKFIINTLKEDNSSLITTFFDLYALDTSFPEFESSVKINDVYQKTQCLEKAFKQDIFEKCSFSESRFFPYIQPYEFEALLFSDIKKLIEIETYWKNSNERLQDIRLEFTTPEHINNSKETAPSSRLKTHLHSPNYRKVLHGTLAVENIGIDKILGECLHFKQWYEQLNALGNA